MRLLEICLVVLSALAAVCLPVGRWRQTGRWLAALALAVAIAHGVLEGVHWQMIPAYAALAIVCISALKSGAGRRWVAVMATCSALLLIAASVGLSFVLPMFRLPKPTGSYPVGTKILYLKDASRIEDAGPVSGQPRELMVQLWYPAEVSSNKLARYREPRETNAVSSYQSVLATNSRLDAPVASAGNPFPVILFNHGWGGRRTNDTFLTEELASHGYVVASIDHTYNASLVAFPDGRQARGNPARDIGDIDSSTQEKVKAIWNKELSKQTADERFVLDQLEAMNNASGTSWYGRMNTHNAGAMGHSFGGSAATEICAVDPRVHAAINMDGWFFAAILARGPNQALMFMNTSGDPLDADSGPNPGVAAFLNASDSADVLASMRKYGGYVLTVDGAEHDDFTDQPLVSPLRRFSHRGTIRGQEMHNIVRAYVLAFFDQTLRGKDSELLRAATSPFPEAKLASWPAPVVAAGR